MSLSAGVATRWYDPAKREPADGAAAADLASRMPRLVARAHEIAASVAYGVHGRRRAGVGETFWQYRPFASGEAAHRSRLAPLGARRSALRARARMGGRARLFPLDGLLALDGLRIVARFGRQAFARRDARPRPCRRAGARRRARRGCWASPRPISARDVIDRLARALAENAVGTAHDDLPPQAPLRPRARVVLISDFLTELDALTARLRRFADAGASGALLMVVDPSEESLPFAGETIFRRHRRRAGLSRRRRAEPARGLCAPLSSASRFRALRGAARRLPVPAASHRPARRRSGAGAGHGPARNRFVRRRGAALMFSFAAPLALIGLGDLAAHLLALARDAAASARDRFSADENPARAEA